MDNQQSPNEIAELLHQGYWNDMGPNHLLIIINLLLLRYIGVFGVMPQNSPKNQSPLIG